MLKNTYNMTITTGTIMINTIIPKPNILDIVNKHVNDTPVNPHSIIPNYIKKTEAEEKLENK